MGGIARGGGHFQPAHCNLAIDTPQAQFQPPRAQPLALEKLCHVIGKIVHHLIEQRAVTDRLHQAPLGERRVLLDHRQKRFGDPPEQLVEA